MTAWRRRPAVLAAVAVLLAGLSGLVVVLTRDQGLTGIHKIQHVVIIMQENRSFDSYFGTFPGADGIPMQNGRPAVCLPDPATGSCAQPYLEKADRNAGGPHGTPNAVSDIDGGAMDGFVAQARRASGVCEADGSACPTGASVDVLGYHDGSTIPNYWAYAKNFVLNDHMFQPIASWSLPTHLFLVSEWSAKCSRSGDPQSCVNNIATPDLTPKPGTFAGTIAGTCRQRDPAACQAALAAYGITPEMTDQLRQLVKRDCNAAASYDSGTNSYTSATFQQCEAALQGADLPADLKQELIKAANLLEPPDYAWTDLTYLLHKHKVSWGYYVMNGT
ncbi:MAG: alkaline phosphatase family protein, partial [Catenulispora sp.]